MAKMGRPRIEIDKDEFEKMCALQCTEREFCFFFSCSEDTINRWCKQTYGKTFAETYSEKRQVGLKSLRRMQFELAEKSATMAIWLGKQYLGQQDSIVRTQDVSDSMKQILEENE